MINKIWETDFIFFFIIKCDIKIIHIKNLDLANKNLVLAEVLSLELDEQAKVYFLELLLLQDYQGQEYKLGPDIILGHLKDYKTPEEFEDILTSTLMRFENNERASQP